MSQVYKAVEASNGVVAVVEQVLRSVPKPSVNKAGGKRYQAPLHVAAERGYGAIAELLVEHGASLETRTRGGDTPLMRAANQGHLEMVCLLLRKGADPFPAPCNDGWTLLHEAAHGGNVDIARLFITKYAANLEAQGRDGETPLMVAARYGHCGMVEFLLGQGAEPSALRKDKWTLLHDAAHGGNVDIAKWVLTSHATQLDACDRHGETPLMVAVQQGHLGMVQFLVDRGASKSAVRRGGWTLLHYAAQEGNVDVARCFMTSEGAELEARNSQGYTPVLVAARYGRWEMVRFLLGQGADASAENKCRWTLLHFAAGAGKVDIAEISIGGRGVDLDLGGGSTLLMLAAENGHVGMVQFLIERGADVHAVDKFQCTALLKACDQGHAEVIKVLAQHGVDVNVGEPLRPLSRAIASGQVAAVQALLNAGANPTAVNMNSFRLRPRSESIRQLVEDAQKVWSSRLEGRKRAAEGGAEAHKGKEPRARPPRTAPAPAPKHTLPAASKGAHDLEEAEKASAAPRRLRKSTPRSTQGGTSKKRKGSTPTTADKGKGRKKQTSSVEGLGLSITGTGQRSDSRLDWDEVTGHLEGLGIEEDVIRRLRSCVDIRGERVGFKDVVGMDSIRDPVRNSIRNPIRAPHLYKGKRAPNKGILLFGLPGNGKTYLAKALACESGSVFINISPSTFMSKWHGKAEEVVKAVFALARKVQPCIIFIDEIDAVGSRREGRNGDDSSNPTTLQQLLVETDGSATFKNDLVFIVGATNRPYALDSALVDRLVMKFYVPSPDASARRLLFEKGLQDVGHNLTDEDFDELVEQTDGYSARVIAGLVRTAARIPLDDLLSVTDDPAHVREDEIPPVSIEHFREALSQVHHVLPEEDKDALREWMRRVNIPIPQGL